MLCVTSAIRASSVLFDWVTTENRCPADRCDELIYEEICNSTKKTANVVFFCGTSPCACTSGKEGVKSV
jgi:hypothetical protein